MPPILVPPSAPRDYLGESDEVAAQIALAAQLAEMTVPEWMEDHFRTEFGI